MLCERYWSPLYHFTRSQGYAHEDAEDLVQGFFAKLLRNKNLRSVSPEKGRLRTFLLTGLRRYMVDDYHRRCSRKRGGESLVVVPMHFEDGAEFELPDKTSEPERVFLQSWARNVLDQALQRLRTSYADRGAADEFDQLAPCLASTDQNYPELAGQLGISVGTLKVRVFRLRRRYQEAILEEVSDGLEHPERDLEAELACLQTAFQ